MVFITRSEVEAMLRKEIKKSSIFSICLDLKNPNVVAAKPYPVGMSLNNCISLMEDEKIQESMLFASLTLQELKLMMHIYA